MPRSASRTWADMYRPVEAALKSGLFFREAFRWDVTGRCRARFPLHAVHSHRIGRHHTDRFSCLRSTPTHEHADAIFQVAARQQKAILCRYKVSIIPRGVGASLAYRASCTIAEDHSSPYRAPSSSRCSSANTLMAIAFSDKEVLPPILAFCAEGSMRSLATRSQPPVSSASNPPPAP